ncbi:MAG: hypothetical protein N2595_01760, partial [bacterium]|nr:hypothetical protein [bacterium]
MKASVCGMVVFVTVPVWAVVTNITSGGGLYGTIQAAVDAANNGDTLLVSTGVYRERVFIAQKSVNLLGGYFADFVTRTSVAAATSITAGGAPGARVTVVSNCTVVLERLWIRNGTNLFGGGMGGEVGGGVTAQQCAIGQNMAWFGGGV